MANFLSGLGRAIQGAGQTYLSVREAERERKRQEELDARQKKLIDLQLAQAALSGLEPGAEVDDQTAELIRNSPLSSRLETTLQATPFMSGPDGSIARGATTGGRTTVRPTLEQRAAMEELEAQRDMRARRNAVAEEYMNSKDPVLQAFGKAIASGTEAPPLPFDEQVRRARQLGEVENKFALQRINAQMAHYTYTRPQTPQERAHLQIFLSILRDNPVVEEDPTSQEAQDAFKQAQAVADFYVSNMFGGRSSAPKETQFGGLGGNLDKMSQFRGAPSLGAKPEVEAPRRDPMGLFK